jgi:AraC-like DNA-binding protein
MRSRLDRVQNWSELARLVQFHAKLLAQRCGVSSRQLQRFFILKTGRTPQKWLNELRQTLALGSLSELKSVKQVSHELGYKQPSHFSREFKRAHGVAPSFAQNPHTISENVAVRYDMSPGDIPLGFNEPPSSAFMEPHGKSRDNSSPAA